MAVAKPFVVFDYDNDMHRFEGGMYDYQGAYKSLAAAKKAAYQGVSQIAEITDQGLVWVCSKTYRTRWEKHVPRPGRRG